MRRMLRFLWRAYLAFITWIIMPWVTIGWWVFPYYRPWGYLVAAWLTFWTFLCMRESIRKVNWPLLRCRLFGHDMELYPDPRPREYLSNGRPKLRMYWAKCRRCGEVHD